MYDGPTILPEEAVPLDLVEASEGGSGRSAGQRDEWLICCGPHEPLSGARLRPWAERAGLEPTEAADRIDARRPDGTPAHSGRHRSSGPVSLFRAAYQDPEDGTTGVPGTLCVL
jgi:hypothetical protein